MVSVPNVASIRHRTGKGAKPRAAGSRSETWTSSSGYTQLTVPFTTGASGSITVYVHGWYAQGTVYADDFAVS